MQTILLANNADSVEELIDDLVSRPRYDTSGRGKRKLTLDLVARVKELLAENAVKRDCG